MIQDFTLLSDTSGNLTVASGIVSQPRNAVAIIANQGVAAIGSPEPVPVNGLTPIALTDGAKFIGGSGRNLIITGLAALNGYYQPQRPTKWGTAGLVFAVTGASAATLHDGTNTVAILSTGGTAPVGSYVATSYGQTTYNGGAAFTLTAAAEQGGPGAPPDVFITVPAPLQGGVYTAIDTVNYISAVDSLWAIIVNEDGSAHLTHHGTIVAIRPSGSNYAADGYYSSVPDSDSYRAGDLPEYTGATERGATNPFSNLTIAYSWSTYLDLDTGTKFLGNRIGYNHAGGAYMSFSGDNTDDSGPEIITIDLAAAWAANAITNYADIEPAADWYNPATGKGRAVMMAIYNGVALDMAIMPGSVTPGSVTPMPRVRVFADGTHQVYSAPWGASVSSMPKAPRAGSVYLTMTEVDGILTAVSGPFMTTTVPTPAAGDYPFILAISDGTKITQTHIGPVSWDSHEAAFATPVFLPAYAVASLPAAVAGAIAFATDSSVSISAGLGAVVAGGGANKTPVYYDGSAWRIG
jgi:hypothetical protein